MELRARSQTSAAIKLLLGLAPKTARIVRADGNEEDIPLEQVQPADVLRVASRRESAVTAWCWKARARWTNPWSPANPFRWRRPQARA